MNSKTDWWLKATLVGGLVEDKGQIALSASLAVKVSGHEDTGAALLSGTLTAQPVDLAVVVNLQNYKNKSNEYKSAMMNKNKWIFYFHKFLVGRQLQ